MDYLLSDFVSDCADISLKQVVKLSDYEVPFKKFLRSPDLHSVVNTELFKASTDPLYLSPNLFGTNLLIHAEPKWTLVYSLYEHIPAQLYTSPMKFLIAPLGDSSLKVDLYKFPKGYNNQVLDRTLRLSEKRSVLAQPGEAIAIDGDTTIMDLCIAEPVGVLKFWIPNQDVLQWTFDRNSLTPIQGISATASGSELAFIARVLGEFKNQSSVHKLRRLSQDHPQHNVRWEAVKAIGRINPEIGLEVIRDATHDKHPHIAAAAQRTLARYAGKS